VPRHLNFRQSHTLQKPTYLPPTIFKIPRNPKQPIDMGNIECPILDMLLEALPIDSVVIHIYFYKDRNRQLLPHIWNSVVKTCRSHNLSFWRQTFVQFFRDIAERCRSSTTKVSKRGRIYPFFLEAQAWRPIEVSLHTCRSKGCTSVGVREWYGGRDSRK